MVRSGLSTQDLGIEGSLFAVSLVSAVQVLDLEVWMNVGLGFTGLRHLWTSLDVLPLSPEP